MFHGVCTPKTKSFKEYGGSVMMIMVLATHAPVDYKIFGLWTAIFVGGLLVTGVIQFCRRRS